MRERITKHDICPHEMGIIEGLPSVFSLLSQRFVALCNLKHSRFGGGVTQRTGGCWSMIGISHKGAIVIIGNLLRIGEQAEARLCKPSVPTTSLCIVAALSGPLLVLPPREWKYIER